LYARETVSARLAALTMQATCLDAKKGLHGCCKENPVYGEVYEKGVGDKAVRKIRQKTTNSIVQMTA
jgi:hypothetical protein